MGGRAYSLKRYAANGILRNEMRNESQ